jgi:hypothetical protein
MPVQDHERDPSSCCVSCRHWQRIDTNPNQGECRRYAPRPEAFESIHMMAAWPITNVDDWCGEFSERS